VRNDGTRHDGDRSARKGQGAGQRSPSSAPDGLGLESTSFEIQGGNVRISRTPASPADAPTTATAGMAIHKGRAVIAKLDDSPPTEEAASPLFRCG